MSAISRFAFTATMAFTLLTNVATPSSHALALSNTPPADTQAPAAKGKLIKFSMRNDTGAPIELKAGEQNVQLQPGKATDFKLAEGTRVLVASAASHYQAGDVVETVSSAHKGATIVLH